MLPKPPFGLRPWLMLLLVSPSLALANDTRPATQFDAMTVTATRSEQAIGDVTSTVTVVSEKEIDQQNINNIQDLVRYEPGISVGGSGSRFGRDGFTIRGIGGNRVLTQVDGVGVPDAFTFGPFLSAQRDYVDLDTVKQVEIIRGPASSLYGSDALGGAVSFITKDARDYLTAEKDWAGRVKLGYDGSDDSWHRSTTWAARLGSDVDVLAHIGQRNGHAIETYGGHGGIGEARKKANPQDFRARNLLLKSGWNYNDSDRLALTYEKFDNRTNTKALNQYSETATIRTYNAHDTADRERWTLQHDWVLDTLLADQLIWQLSYQTGETRQRTEQLRVSRGVESNRLRDSHYREKLWNLNAAFEKFFTTAGWDHQLTYGVDLKRLKNSDLRRGSEYYTATGQPVPDTPYSEKFPVSDFPDPITHEYAFFIQDDITRGRWSFLPGLRYDHYTLKPHAKRPYLNANPLDRNPSSFSDHKLSPKLGVTYEWDQNHTLYGQYAAGFRAPNAVDIFGEFVNVAANYQTIANQNLKAETSDSFEVGVRGKYSVGSMGLALFYNRYDDFIEQVTLANDPTGNGRMTFQYQNLDRVTIRGAEARGELFLDSIGLPIGSTLRGSLAYARGEDSKNHRPLNSIDPLKAVFGLGYTEPNNHYGAELMWTVVAKKNRIDRSTIKDQYASPGYGLLDLTAFWQVADGLTLNAGLYNLTDKKYWNWADVRSLSSNSLALDRYTQPGRYGAVNAVWEF